MGMPITYFRSSSYNGWDMCPMQYMIEYVLGHRGKSGLAADKGTIVHKVLEIIANAKIAHQGGLTSITETDIGTHTWTVHEDTILDEEQVDEITNVVFEYYKTRTPHKWAPKDYRDVHKWVQKALALNDGEFDPRNKDIVEAEARFDFEIEEPWAYYKLDEVEGFLALKGTIDQVNRVDDTTLEILDWKTGRRLNWATGKEKDYAALCKDPQLRIYHYAAHKMWPEIEQILVTIYFINDGGPFTVCFEPEELKETEKMLQKRFEEIKTNEMPQKKVSWKCSKFCGQGKSTFEGTANKEGGDIKPLIQRQDGHVTKAGQVMSKCEQTDYALRHKGMESVIKNMTADGHEVAFYKAPGEVEEEKKD